MLEKTRQDFDRESAAGQTTAGKLGTLWCALMHDSPMWPIHGQYQCRICGRRYAVPWAGDKFLARVRQARPILPIRFAATSHRAGDPVGLTRSGRGRVHA
jgi:hypothetical protein